MCRSRNSTGCEVCIAVGVGRRNTAGCKFGIAGGYCVGFTKMLQGVPDWASQWVVYVNLTSLWVWGVTVLRGAYFTSLWIGIFG